MNGGVGKKFFRKNVNTLFRGVSIVGGGGHSWKLPDEKEKIRE